MDVLMCLWLSHYWCIWGWYGLYMFDVCIAVSHLHFTTTDRPGRGRIADCLMQHTMFKT